MEAAGKETISTKQDRQAERAEEGSWTRSFREMTNG